MQSDAEAQAHALTPEELPAMAVPRRSSVTGAVSLPALPPED